MRIRKLDFLAWGHFVDRQLDFGDEPFSVIYGDNEAGKSTALRGLIALLFGVDARSRDNFLFHHNQLRIRGTLVGADGRTLSFVRRKGNKDTLLDPETDQALDPALLVPFLAGQDKDQFSRICGMDHQGLRDGGQELLQQRGDLGAALFSSALGSAGHRNLLSDLEAEAGAIFAPRGQKHPLNQALADLKAATIRIRESSLPAKEWTDLKKELASTREDLDQVNQDLGVLQGERSRLERIRSVLVPLAERRGLLDALEELAGSPDLPETFTRELAELRLRLARDESELRQKQEKLELRRTEAREVRVDEELLAREPGILQLQKEAVLRENELVGRPDLVAARDLLHKEAAAGLRVIRPDLTPEEGESLRPLLLARDLITRMVRERERLLETQADLTAKAADLEARLKDETELLGRLSREAADLTDLKAAAASARKAGDLDQRLTGAEREARKLHSSCLKDLAALGRFQGDLARLEVLALPGPETTGRFERDFQALEGLEKKLEIKLEELEKRQAERSGELARLLGEYPVPSLEELSGAREARDRDWLRLRGLYIEASLEKTPEDQDLPDRFQHRLTTTDQLSDQLLRNADAVHKKRSLDADLELIRREHSELQARKAELGTRRRDLEEQWHRVWEPLAVTPGTPREMEAWLGRAGDLVREIGRAEQAAQIRDDLMEQISGLRNRLGALLAVQGLEAGDRGLEELLCFIEDLVREDEKRKQDRAGLQASLEGNTRAVARLRDQLRDLETELGRWTRNWTEATRGLGPDLAPLVATRVLEGLGDFFSRGDRAAELTRELDALDRRARDFAARVTDLARDLARSPGEPQETIAALVRDLVRAKEDRTRLDALNRNIRILEEEVREAEVLLEQDRSGLERLRQRSGGEHDADLDELAERSDRKRRLRADLAAVEKQLREAGDGLDPVQLEEEAGHINPDTLPGERREALEKLEALGHRRDELRDRLSRLIQNEAALDKGSAAAQARQDAAEQLAVIGKAAEDYLRLKIAALILGQEMERYRKEHQNPVLRSAGQLLATLTLGSFTGLRDELSPDGRPLLRGIRSDGIEVDIEGMSTGTRDQLYLALRLATLEQHLSPREPMPLVVDDILVDFDDKRTRAGLQVLSQFSGKTQVLLFTHHRRVAELTLEAGLGRVVELG